MHSQTSSPRRAASYRRVSTTRQKVEGHGLDAQQNAATVHAERIHAIITHEFEDDDSGKIRNLPGLEAMLNAARRGEFEVVIADKHDRLARNRVKQALVEEELDRYAIEIQYVKYQVDRSTAGGRLHSNIMADFAEYERELILERLEGGKWAKARAGLVVGGCTPPYGYRYKHELTASGARKVIGLEPDPATAPILRRIFAEAVHQSSTRIAEGLTAEGVPTPKGGTTWRASTIRQMIDSTAHEGFVTYGRRLFPDKRVWRPEGEWIKVAIDPIVSEAERAAALAGYERRRKRRSPRRSTVDDPFILRGMLRCGVCGRGLAAIRASRGRYYRCLASAPSQAKQNAIDYHPLSLVPAVAIEAETYAAVRFALSDEAALQADIDRQAAVYSEAAARSQERTAFLVSEIATFRRRLDRATRERLDAEQGSEADRSLERTIAELSRDLDRYGKELAALRGEPAPGLTPAQAATLQEHATEIRTGMAALSGAELRELYTLLALEGHVTEGEEGAPMGRHRFAVRWEAIIDVPDVVQGGYRVPARQPITTSSPKRK